MWSDFESEVVEGRYPLGKLVRSEGRCGWFETRFDEKAAIISLIESLNDETTLLERLRAAEKVSNENVAAIFESGATRLRHTPVVYAVMEYTEENLEDVLRTRALSAEESKQVAKSLLNALRAIHKERLVCGRLEAASVLAAGETIKLRSDYLQLAPQNTAFEPYAAKDLRDLASLLHQCLTQQPLKRAIDGNDPSLQLLPQPFVQVVRRTLSGQTTVDDIAALLEPADGVASTPARPNRAQESNAETLPVKPPQPAEKSAPVKVDEPPLPERTSRSMSKSMLLILGGLLVLLVLAGFMLRAMLRTRSNSPAVDTTAASLKADAEAAPSKSPAAVPVPAEKPKSVAAPSTASPAPSPTGAWRVVAFTYNYQSQAEHKAHTINEKHPDLQASVFSPKGNGAPFLVTLGAGTDRASAFRLRDKAVQEGLPHDTYTQNYSR